MWGIGDKACNPRKMGWQISTFHIRLKSTPSFGTLEKSMSFRSKLAYFVFGEKNSLLREPEKKKGTITNITGKNSSVREIPGC